MPDTPRREIAVGMTGRDISVFPQVEAPHVDKMPAGEVGHRLPAGPVATIR
jgi:hypothetical protein